MPSRVAKHLNVNDFATVNRRSVLRSLGAAAVLTATGGLFSRSAWSNPVFPAYPFALGVASGDPASDGFVIWTKIASKPLEHGGGMPKMPVEVEWAVASDERMQQAVQKGKAIAHPELGHAVHVEVAGLEPARDYFYQFSVGSERSATGRARTFPRAGAALAQLRLPSRAASATKPGFIRHTGALPLSASILSFTTATISTSIAPCAPARCRIRRCA
jgi:alkaline phosphatase D